MEPAAALSPVAQEMVAEIIKVVLIGWGCVVDRLAQESSVELPKDGLTMTTLVAGLKMPAAWVTRKIANQTERRAVEVLLKEYEQTGTVTQNLPDEVRQVRATRAADTGNSLREEPLPVTEKLQPVTPEPIAEKHEPVKVADSEPVSVEAKPHFDRKVATEAPEPIEMEAAEETPAESREKPEMVIHRIRAPRLNQNSPLADAPSIGPKTAERFAQIDIDTVGEFLKASPVDLNKRLRTKWITTELLQDWQAQCRLACSLGHLRAVQVQLLVGAGVKTAEQLVAADPQALASEIHRYCLTSVGKRILRGGNEPTAEDVIGWIREAKQILKAKEGAA